MAQGGRGGAVHQHEHLPQDRLVVFPDQKLPLPQGKLPVHLLQRVSGLIIPDIRGRGQILRRPGEHFAARIPRREGERIRGEHRGQHQKAEGLIVHGPAHREEAQQILDAPGPHPRCELPDVIRPEGKHQGLALAGAVPQPDFPDRKTGPVAELQHHRRDGQEPPVPDLKRQPDGLPAPHRPAVELPGEAQGPCGPEHTDQAEEKPHRQQHRHQEQERAARRQGCRQEDGQKAQGQRNMTTHSRTGTSVLRMIRTSTSSA